MLSCRSSTLTHPGENQISRDASDGARSHFGKAFPRDFDLLFLNVAIARHADDQSFDQIHTNLLRKLQCFLKYCIRL